MNSKMINSKTFNLFFIFIFFVMVAPSWGYNHNYAYMYFYDNMGWADKNRMVNISEEMIQDAQLRIRQIIDIRDEHSHLLAFDIGVIMGNIREKYRRMVETYREYRDKHSGRSQLFPPSFMWYFVPAYYIVAMQLVHVQEVEIDRLVQILEHIDNDDLNPDPRYVHLSQTTRRRTTWALREGDWKIIKQMEAEQELKSSLREKHLMRRLRQGEAQHTTAKRFQKKWPVDGNWELGAYGDLGLYAGH